MDNRITVPTLIIIMIALVFFMMMSVYVGMTAVAQRECEALGFEWGTYTLYPDRQIECEYRLRVPLHEVLPDIDGGETDDNAHLYSRA